MSIPKRFKYLSKTVAKYCVNAVQVENPRGTTFDRNRYIDTLSNAEMAEIAKTYCEIERRKDSKEISEWVLNRANDDDPAQRRVFLLFVLFQALAERGIEPFSSGSVQFQSDPPKFDWSKLPPSIAFLAKPAEEYGRYQFPGEVDRFFRRITKEELKELKQLARVCRENKKVISDFLALPMTEHPESAYVYFLLGVLDCPLVSEN